MDKEGTTHPHFGLVDHLQSSRDINSKKRLNNDIVEGVTKKLLELVRLELEKR